MTTFAEEVEKLLKEDRSFRVRHVGSSGDKIFFKYHDVSNVIVKLEVNTSEQLISISLEYMNSFIGSIDDLYDITGLTENATQEVGYLSMDSYIDDSVHTLPLFPIGCHTRCVEYSNIHFIQAVDDKIARLTGKPNGIPYIGVPQEEIQQEIKHDMPCVDAPTEEVETETEIKTEENKKENTMMKNMMNKMVAEVTNVVFDMTSNSLGFLSNDNIITFNGRAVEENPIVDLSMTMPAFGMRTPFADIKQGDIYIEGDKAIGFVVGKTKTGNLQVVTSKGTKKSVAPVVNKMFGTAGVLVAKNPMQMGGEQGGMFGGMNPMMLMAMSDKGDGGLFGGGDGMMKNMMLMQMMSGGNTGGMFGAAQPVEETPDNTSEIEEVKQEMAALKKLFTGTIEQLTKVIEDKK